MRKGNFFRCAVLAFLVLASLPALADPASRTPASPPASEDPFPEYQALEPRVLFWIDVYTRYTTRQVVLHDEDHPQVVYGVVDLGGEPDAGRTPFPDTDEDRMERAVDRVVGILARLETQDAAGDADEERLVRGALSRLAADTGAWTAADWNEARDRVRAQRGQADRFRAGLARSGRYVEAFRTLAREEGVPEDLAYLPHVESSFETGARSSAGAAGFWQFMRSTARQYMTVNSTVDERLDPWIAARAAFAHMRGNYEALESWPLAVTAYNHGRGGMLRAKAQFGDDLQQVIEAYRSRTFGFASKNFYAEFLAARRIVRHPEMWFGPVTWQPALRFDILPLRDAVKAGTLVARFDLSLAELELLNPALPVTVWSGKRVIPRRHKLRVPEGQAARMENGWEGIPAAERFYAENQDLFHRVRTGENLTLIARRYGTSVRTITSLNNISARGVIRPGQRLKVGQTRGWRAADSTVTVDAQGMIRHVVRLGETLTSIAGRYGIAVSAIAGVNGIRNPSLIRAGQILLIPGGK